MDQQDIVLQSIKKAIIEHRLPPGTRLREVQLAEIYDVKRGLIRKVLAQLTREKLIDHQPNAGAQVAQPSIKEGQDLFATRRILEQSVIQTLCDSITADQINTLREYLKTEETAYQQSDHPLGVRLSTGFHRELARLAGNQIIEEFLNEIINRTPLVILSQLGQQAPNGCVNHEHCDIVDALAQKDPDTATRLMNEHLSHLEKLFNTNVAQPKTELVDQLQPESLIKDSSLK